MFKSPYAHLQQKERERVNTYVDPEHKRILKGISVDGGFLSWATETFIHSLFTDIQNHGITHYTPENAKLLTEFVRQRTGPQLNVPKPGVDDSGRITSLRPTAANPSRLPANLVKGDSRRDEGRGGDGEKRKGREVKGRKGQSRE